MVSTDEKTEPKLISRGQFLEVIVYVFGTAIILSGINGFVPSLVAALVMSAVILLLIAAVNLARRSRWKKANQPKL